jgi:hypothetical protein
VVSARDASRVAVSARVQRVGHDANPGRRRERTDDDALLPVGEHRRSTHPTCCWAVRACRARAGASHAGCTAVTLPAELARGAYYVIAQADAGNALPETSETNNNKRAAWLKVGADLM